MADVFQVTVTGLSDVLSRTDAIGVAARQGAEATLVQSGERIMGDAKELAPVDLGTLRNSGYVLSPSVLIPSGPFAQPSGEARGMVENQTDVVVAVGFGGPSAPYALIQHEQFPVKRVAGKQWKYLETPAKAHAGRIPERMAEQVRRRIEARGAAG